MSRFCQRCVKIVLNLCHSFVNFVSQLSQSGLKFVSKFFKLSSSWFDWLWQANDNLAFKPHRKIQIPPLRRGSLIFNKEPVEVDVPVQAPVQAPCPHSWSPSPRLPSWVKLIMMMMIMMIVCISICYPENIGVFDINSTDKLSKHWLFHFEASH